MKHTAGIYPQASVIRVVLDITFNTHKIESLYAVFPVEQAHDLARRLEFHFVQHAPAQGIPDKDHLRREVVTNVNARNAKAAPVNWHFTSQDAHRKLACLYPRFST